MEENKNTIFEQMAIRKEEAKRKVELKYRVIEADATSVEEARKELDKIGKEENLSKIHIIAILKKISSIK